MGKLKVLKDSENKRLLVTEDGEPFFWMGDKFTKTGKGPMVFNEKNAYTYGQWLGNRYKDKTNIV